MHFLLDTNIFVDYVKDNKDTHFIEQIIHLAEEGVIQILVPNVLLSEWKEKREKTLEYVSKAIESTTSISVNEMASSILKEDYKYSNLRAISIDKLLANGISIKTTQSVKAETIDRSIEHRAPFHGGKSKTINDALIYFTSMHYLKKNKVSKFVFITKDSGDFGSPYNKNEVLHPELQDSNVVTLYFTSLYKCFDKLKDELKFKQPDREGLYQLIISKRKNKNILEHLFDVIQVWKSKINFLPTHILSKIEPFRIIDIRNDYAYHSGTTLLTNNKHLLDFFKQVDIKKMRFKNTSEFRNTKGNLEKLNYIITSLNENLVFDISHVTHIERIDIRHQSNKKCTCANCSYGQLSFSKLLKEVYNENDDLKRAFVLFQLGKFTEALVVYNTIYQNAIKGDNKILSYRILLVLHWVAQFADYRENNSDDRALLNMVNSADREKAFISALNGSKLDREIALFFHGSTMINHYRLIIKEIVEKIKEHYQSQLKASYSSNSNLQNLINSFLNFEMFTIYNGMAVTKFSDFESICDDFTEGIFMSIALNEYQSSRLEYLDDYILEKLLFYGKADKMIRYFNRYIKKQIAYQSKEKAFERIVSNFLNSDTETINYFSNVNNYNGSTTFYKIFWNILLLLAIVDFNRTFLLKCTAKIYNFLEILPKGETHQLHHLASLINSKGKVLKKEALQPLFKFIIANPNLHNINVLEEVSSVKGYDFKLDITSFEFESLCELFFNKCEKCDVYHKETLYQLYPILPKKCQIQITNTVNERLRENFDEELYYMAVLADIIDYELFFNQYLNLIAQVKKSSRSFYNLSGELHYRQLNNLMNLVFKIKIELPDSYIKNFKGHSDYYDWIIDMKRFDYRKFKPIWIIQYPTKYYLEEAFSIENVKTLVRQYLRENNQPTLANYYCLHVK